jgi:hypothetical protein
MTVASRSLCACPKDISSAKVFAGTGETGGDGGGGGGGGGGTTRTAGFSGSSISSGGRYASSGRGNPHDGHFVKMCGYVLELGMWRSHFHMK